MKKERWTESEVLALPSGEHDFFERKSGALLLRPEFERKLAKAISALSNSGGGYLIIGVEDGGSIDGVPKLRKGRTTTRDWLEQVIPNLVSRPLQDFRVHEVEPDTSSLIPSGHVLIVIDIGDSVLAPHQDAFSKHYYHRSGGRSDPAPHHHLEMLWGREKYPSRRIAHAWLNFVLSPLLYSLGHEQDNLVHLKQPWNEYQMSTRSWGHFNTIAVSLSATGSQFLRSYPDIKESIDHHDRGVTNLRTEAETLVRTIETSSHLVGAYSTLVTPEYLQRIRDNYGSRFDGSETDEKLLNQLFGSRPKPERLNAIAKYMAYDYPETLEIHNLWPLWATYKRDLMELLTLSPIREQQEVVVNARRDLLQRVQSLISLLERTRHELAFKHGEPYEDSTLHRDNSSHSSLLQ
jgi:hypothetical protein